MQAGRVVMITLDDVAFLKSAAGEALLERLAAADLSEGNVLRLVTTLRKTYPPELVRAGVEMAQLRLRAVDKFGADAGHMLFTREALEQASDPLVRRYRAEVVGRCKLVDACCGIGTDAVAFAQGGAQVMGIDLEPIRVAMAAHNAEVSGAAARFEVGDVRGELPAGDVVFFDPARRDADGKRIHDVERYLPPLSVIEGWAGREVIVKLSPGVELEAVERYGGMVEFISVSGELKEAVLWRGGRHRGRKATLLAGDSVLHWQTERVTAAAEARLGEPHGWLIEPDPALLRAGLVTDVVERFEGWMLDPTIAYFTTDDAPDSMWVRGWRVLDWMPFNVKRLRAYLRERDVGRVTVKKRGSPVTPESLIPQLKLKGSGAVTVVLTRLRGDPIVIICEEQPASR